MDLSGSIRSRIAELECELRDLSQSGIDRGDIAQDAGEASLARDARIMLLERAALAEHFNPDLFGDPAMDILLFLFAHGEDGSKATTTICCAAVRGPRTTALRWIKLLEKQGLIVSTGDVMDGRVTLLELSDRARDGVACWLRKISILRRTHELDRSSRS